MLAFGRAGDIWSHGRVFRIGLLWSAVAYLFCAVAPSYGWLLFFRFLQGIGAALIVSCAPALVTGLFPEDKRSRAVGIFTFMYAIGSAAGPLLGGFLVQFWGWPAVFWFRAPIALAALLFLKGLPPIARAAAREPVDIVGAVLLALGISTLLLTFNELQRLTQDIALAVALAGIAATTLGGFVCWENRIAQPIVNLGLLRTDGFAIVNLASLLVYLTSFSVLLFGPYYLVRFIGLPAPMAGGVLGASFVGSILASPLAGRVVERIPAGRVAAFGAVLGGASLALIGEWSPGASWQPAVIVGSLVLQGFGVGLFQVAYMEIVMSTLPRHQRGVAGSIGMLSRSLGVVTGATLLTLAFHVIEAGRLAGGRAPELSFLAAYKMTFWMAGGVSALAGLLVLAMAAPRRLRG
jgi:MFS family permease